MYNMYFLLIMKIRRRPFFWKHNHEITTEIKKHGVLYYLLHRNRRKALQWELTEHAFLLDAPGTASPCGHTRRGAWMGSLLPCQGHHAHWSCGFACSPLTFFHERGLDVFMSRFMDVNETLGILYLIFFIQGWRLFSNILLHFTHPSLCVCSASLTKRMKKQKSHLSIISTPIHLMDYVLSAIRVGEGKSEVMEQRRKGATP